MKITAQFRLAREDYLYLINRGFPAKSALDFVGNHYQLGKNERLLLFRGLRDTQAILGIEHRLLVFPAHATSGEAMVNNDIPFHNDMDDKQLFSTLPKQDTLIQNPAESSLLLLIDGYNVLGTIMSYLLGRQLFIANDGILRDIGAFHGTLSCKQTALEQAITLLAQTCLCFFNGFSIKVFLDEPVSQSAHHKILVVTIFKKYYMHPDVEIIHSADFGLIHAKGGILCTSDSVILNTTQHMILDLPRLVLEHSFHAHIPHIDDL